MKHAGARWLDEMYNYIEDNPQLVVNGFVKIGIPQVINLFYEEESDEQIEQESDMKRIVMTERTAIMK